MANVSAATAFTIVDFGGIGELDGDAKAVGTTRTIPAGPAEIVEEMVAREVTPTKMSYSYLRDCERGHQPIPGEPSSLAFPRWQLRHDGGSRSFHNLLVGQDLLSSSAPPAQASMLTSIACPARRSRATARMFASSRPPRTRTSASSPGTRPGMRPTRASRRCRSRSAASSPRRRRREPACKVVSRPRFNIPI